MLEPFNPSWHGGIAALRGGFDRRQVDRAIGHITKGHMPEDFYALPRDAMVLALGFGCGVQILRLASWGELRRVVCVEPDPIVRGNAEAILRTCGVRGVTLVDRNAGAVLEAGARVDLLLLEPGYARAQDILDILSRYQVTAVIGTFDPTVCSDAQVYRACSGRAARFNVQNAHTGRRVIGDRRVGPDVSVIVAVHPGEDGLARTLRSLAEQSNVELEVLLAPVDESAHVQSCDLDALHGPAFPSLRLRGCLPSVTSALEAAQGAYVTLIDAGDVCDSGMIGSMFDEAAPSREDIALCAYRKVQYSDGSIQVRYTIGHRGLDLRGGPRVCAPGTLDGLEVPPVLGRCLYRRGFLDTVRPIWDAGLGAFAATVFQAQCLFSASRMVTIGSAYLEHWETAEELTGERYRLGGVASVRKIFQTLSSCVLERSGNYARELALRGLLAQLYISLYGDQEGVRGRWTVSKAMLSDCLAPMRFGSQLEFAVRGLRRLVRR